MKQEHLRFRKGDFLAIVLVAVLAVAVALCFLPENQTGPVVAEIYRNAELVKTCSLETDTVFEITGKYTNEITVKNGEICISASDCPGEDCVHSGAIKATGRSIVCLPNEVEIRVVSGVSDVDFVVG